MQKIKTIENEKKKTDKQTNKWRNKTDERDGERKKNSFCVQNAVIESKTVLNWEMMKQKCKWNEKVKKMVCNHHKIAHFYRMHILWNYCKEMCT